jgi:hypothetical protein
MSISIILQGRVCPALGHHPKHGDYLIEEIRVLLGEWKNDNHVLNYLSETYPPDEGEWFFSTLGLRELLGEIQSGVLNNTGDGPYDEDAFEYAVATLQSAIAWVEGAPESEWRDAVLRISN